jgi:F-type H+-transporting ATPase subunit epsilon
VTATLHFNLVTPEHELASEEVDRVDVPGAEGIFGVLPDHTPVVTPIAPGVLRVIKGGEERRVFVRRGFAEVTREGLTVLAEEAIPVNELDATMIGERIKHCEEDLADADALPETRERAERELRQLKELQAAL